MFILSLAVSILTLHSVSRTSIEFMYWEKADHMCASELAWSSLLAIEPFVWFSFHLLLNVPMCLLFKFIWKLRVIFYKH